MMQKVEKTLKIIKELKGKKVFKDFSIGGGIAALYYIEPLLTYDLDIFFIPIEDSIDVLAPIYRYLKEKGFKTKGEHVLIEGVPVQFIPAYNDLVKEAVLYSDEVKYGRIKTKVLGLEYLIAVMLQTYRPKDRERLVKIFEEAKFDLKILKTILKKYGLYDKYVQFKGKYFDTK
jgi:predicted nucleotidyltransferase